MLSMLTLRISEDAVDYDIVEIIRRDNITYNNCGQETGYKQILTTTNGSTADVEFLTSENTTRSNVAYDSQGRVISYEEIVFSPPVDAADHIEGMADYWFYDVVTLSGAVYDALGRMSGYTRTNFKRHARDPMLYEVLTTTTRIATEFNSNGQESATQTSSTQNGYLWRIRPYHRCNRYY